MPLKKDITKAISSHGMWKQRIIDAINTGKSEWTPDVIREDNNCDFGKWLNNCTEEEQSSSNYIQTKALHKKFHIIAADVLSMALSGQKDKASKAIDIGSDYSRISTNLKRELLNWLNTTKE